MTINWSCCTTLLFIGGINGLFLINCKRLIGRAVFILLCSEMFSLKNNSCEFFLMIPSTFKAEITIWLLDCLQLATNLNLHLFPVILTRRAKGSHAHLSLDYLSKT
eukprot:NODE_130_length_18488_cov_0.389961.p14 type:complete len:106 gc:universal NODE_130_length_18488_cov_0.389961:16272-15955(-)